jgi:hypothetical protein
VPDMVTDGEEDMQKVEEEIKAMRQQVLSSL